MKNLILLAGAAALCAAGPVVAKPGKGGGKPHAAHAVKTVKPVRTVKANKAVKVKALTRVQDRNRNGILDADEALARRYGGAICPPGLAKKTPACVPPGQANRLFRVGQRVPLQYRYITPFMDIPLVFRDQYDLDPDFRYIYRNNVIYVVDPTTNLITNILDAVL